MNKLMMIATLGTLVLGSLPVRADGAPPDDCNGKTAGATCYRYAERENGFCVADDVGLLSCEVPDSGGGAGGHGGSGDTTDGAVSGCSMRRARALGAPEATGLLSLLTVCVALQARRRRR